MSTYPISRVFPSDGRRVAAVDDLLEHEGIRRDAHLDYTCAMFDDEGRAIATGSCFGNTLRCMAVSSDHQGEMLMNEIVTHLMEVEAERGVFRLFLYTKCQSAKFFRSLGFYEVARAEGKAVLMENRRDGFSSYLATLAKSRVDGARSSAVVMNANPFTNGHLHLVRTASAASDVVHLFVVSEDKSLFPYSVRRRLVEQGVEVLGNVVIHDSGPYIISSATFPSYFLGDDLDVATSHATLDAAVFCKIAQALGVTRRFVGEERTSKVTAAYNEALARELPQAGVELVVVPRVTADGGEAAVEGEPPVSASTVRQLLQADDLEGVRRLVPPSTFSYLTSPEAAPVIARIKAAGDVVHH